MTFLNGHKKVLGVAAIVGAICTVLSWLGGVYTGWTQRVEAAVVVQRMVNANDETLKAIVPKVETCHGVNEHQEWEIQQNQRDLAVLTANVKSLTDMMQAYFQSKMKDGEIRR